MVARRRVGLVVALFGLSLSGLIGWQRIAGDPGPVWNLKGEALESFPPGLDVAAATPEGCSDVVIRVKQRVDPRQADLIDETSRSHVSRYVSILGARVKRPENGGRFRFDGFIQGLSTDINGRPRIVTLAKLDQLGAESTFSSRYVLRRLEENSNQARVEARSDTFALLLTRALMVRNGRHRPVALRYGVVLDAATGKLTTFIWGVDVDGQRLTNAFGPIRRLPPSLEWNIDLHVDPTEFTLGIPRPNALGVPDLPAGVAKADFPPNQLSIFAQTPPTKPMLDQIEATLRRLAAN
jgi:hypothetical protein